MILNSIMVNWKRHWDGTWTSEDNVERAKLTNTKLVSQFFKYFLLFKNITIAYRPVAILKNSFIDNIMRFYSISLYGPWIGLKNYPKCRYSEVWWITIWGVNGSGRIGLYYFIIFLDPTPLNSGQKIFTHTQSDGLWVDPTRPV
jgi:hypothetical protein